MALIDTNILVYVLNEDSQYSRKANTFLKGLVEGTDPWQISWINVFEFLRVITDPRSIQGKALYIDEAIDFVQNLLAAPTAQMIHPGSRHYEIFTELASHTPGVRGPFIHDTRIAAIMLENGVRKIYTNDDGFRRFRDIQVVNPFN